MDLIEKTLDLLNEKAPPDKEIEDWIQEMKPKFKKEYGKNWSKVLYALAWKKYEKKKGEK